MASSSTFTPAHPLVSSSFTARTPLHPQQVVWKRTRLSLISHVYQVDTQGLMSAHSQVKPMVEQKVARALGSELRVGMVPIGRWWPGERSSPDEQLRRGLRQAIAQQEACIASIQSENYVVVSRHIVVWGVTSATVPGIIEPEYSMVDEMRFGINPAPTWQSLKSEVAKRRVDVLAFGPDPDCNSFRGLANMGGKIASQTFPNGLVLYAWKHDRVVRAPQLAVHYNTR